MITGKDKYMVQTPTIVQKDKDAEYIVSMTSHRQDFKLSL